MIARLEVTRGPLTEYPLAEKVRGGWQNGVTFYPDAEVTKFTEVVVRSAHDGQCEAEYVVGAACYSDCGCSNRALEAVKAEATCEWCTQPARGDAWHNDGKLHPSCGQIDHGQGWVPQWRPVETEGAPDATA